jgi:hypothetical protein
MASNTLLLAGVGERGNDRDPNGTITTVSGWLAQPAMIVRPSAVDTRPPRSPR